MTQTEKRSIPAPGVYVLTRDVENPARDKRRTSDWRHAPTFEKGTLFVVSEHHDLPPSIHLLNGYSSEYLCLWKTLGDAVYEADWARTGALVPALEPAQVTVETLFSDSNGDPHPNRARAILQKLVDTGFVTLPEIRRAWRAVEHDEDREAEEHDQRVAEKRAAEAAASAKRNDLLIGKCRHRPGPNSESVCRLPEKHDGIPHSYSALNRSEREALDALEGSKS